MTCSLRYEKRKARDEILKLRKMKKVKTADLSRFEKFRVKNPEKIFGGLKTAGRRESTNVEYDISVINYALLHGEILQQPYYANNGWSVFLNHHG